MRRFIALVALVLAVLSDSASQAAETPLYQLACRYEAEVEAMEKIVKCTRGVDRADQRLLVRLDEEIGRLRLAAKNPRHFNRLVNQWTRVGKLSRQTESTLFEKYTPNHAWLGQVAFDVATRPVRPARQPVKRRGKMVTGHPFKAVPVHPALQAVFVCVSSSSPY